MLQQTEPDRKFKIDTIKITTDNLTNRAGLNLFVKYIFGIGIYPYLQKWFGTMKKTGKGYAIVEMFKQLFCFFAEGSSRHMAWFDRLKEDRGYAGIIETSQEELYSTNQVKRFFRKFSFVRIYIFRWLLLMLFSWRLKLKKPKRVIIGIDTMVMDNNDAENREGCQPTYKKKKGFQPLHFFWNNKVIDVVFRGGAKHSNHGETVQKSIMHLLKKIRKEYDPDVPVVFVFDAGFFDQKIFEHIESLDAYYIGTAKTYQSVKDKMLSLTDDDFFTYVKKKQVWKYHEFRYECNSWNKDRRAIYTVPVCEPDGQMVLTFKPQEQVIITNIEEGDCSSAKEIIEIHHARGNDELIHRKIKEFGDEKLPFKRFNCNAAYYNLMLVTFFLFHCFIEDVASKAIPDLKVNCYINTARRKILDFAGKIVKTSNSIFLKVTNWTLSTLNLKTAWILCKSPPALPALA